MEMARINNSPQIIGSLDIVLLSVTLVLVGLGLVMVYSTTGVVSQEHFHDSFFYVKRQAMAAVIGLLALACGVSLASTNALRRYSSWCFPGCILLLVLTAMPGIGDDAGGARRWINLGFIRFQPGEIVKLAFLIFFAGYLTRHQERITTFKHGVVIPLFFLACVAGLFLRQPDFGSASVIVICSLVMLTISGLRLRYLALAFAICTVSAAVLVYISPYRMARVMSFLSPTNDPSGRGYQLIQSLIAVANGGFEGLGLGNSQQKLFFLPAAHTDFIFAVICEELGNWGALAVVGLFCWFLLRGVSGAMRLGQDSFGFALAAGLTMLICAQAFLNMGVVIGMLPTKGLVLPLVGYGGSSLITSMFAVGLLLGLIRKIPSGSR